MDEYKQKILSENENLKKFYEKKLKDEEERKKDIIKRVKSEIVFNEVKYEKNYLEINLLSNHHDHFYMKSSDCEMIKNIAINELGFNPNVKCKIEYNFMKSSSGLSDYMDEATSYKVIVSDREDSYCVIS